MVSLPAHPGVGCAREAYDLEVHLVATGEVYSALTLVSLTEAGQVSQGLEVAFRAQVVGAELDCRALRVRRILQLEEQAQGLRA